MLSREAFFLLNNLLFMGVLVVCFWGVLFPLISELFTGQKVTVGPPFYERSVGPLGAGLLLLMAIAPLSAWGHSTWKTLGKAMWKPAAASIVAVVVIYALGIHSWGALLGFFLCALVIFVVLYEYYRGIAARNRRNGENVFSALWNLVGRNRRRYGGYIIHLGVALISLGIIGIEMFQTETQGTIALGDTLSLADYKVTFDRLDIFDKDDGRNVARAVMSVEKDGKYLGELYPRRDYYYDSQQPMTIPGVRSTIEDDLYVILVDWEPISSTGVTFKVYHNPLVNWLWIGGIVFILGMLVAAWPEKDDERVRVSGVDRRMVSGSAKAS